MKDPTKPLRLNALCAALLIRAMMDGPCTVGELVAVSGLARHAVWRYLRALIKVKAIHVAEWESDALGRPQIPAYMLGEGKSVPRPKQPAKVRTSRRAQRYQREAQQVLNQMMAGPIVSV